MATEPQSTNQPTFPPLAASTRRRLRRPTGSPVRTATTAATISPRINEVSSSKQTAAQDRSDQVVAPSSSRFRVRNKNRKAATAGTAVVAAGAATALAATTSKKAVKDKDGYKVTEPKN